MNIVRDGVFWVVGAVAMLAWACVVGLAIGFVLVTVSNPWMGL